MTKRGNSRIFTADTAVGLGISASGLLPDLGIGHDSFTGSGAIFSGPGLQDFRSQITRQAGAFQLYRQTKAADALISGDSLGQHLLSAGQKPGR